MSGNTRILKVTLTATAALGWAVLAWPQAATAPAKDYEIKLSRPMKVGQTFQLSVSGKSLEEQAVKGGGQDQTKKEELVYETKGTIEILKVTDRGERTEVAFTIESCIKIDGGKQTEAAPKGTVVIVTGGANRKDVKAKDPNVALSADARAIIQEVVEVDTGHGNDDDAFGTQKRQKVGDSWPVNSEFMAKELAQMLGSVKKEDITGQVKLVGLTKAASLDCLELAAEVAVKNIAPPLPPGAKVDKSEMSMKFTGYFPLDPIIPMVGGAKALALAVAMKVTGPDGTEVSLTLKKESNQKATETPIRR